MAVATPYPMGRRIEFDEGSKRYRLGLVMSRQYGGVIPPAFSTCWSIGHLMNQMDRISLDDAWGWDPSSCTGFSRAHACNADPIQMNLTTRDAFELYRAAQAHDQWLETPPAEGSSVLAAAKAAQDEGYVQSYWWALTYEEFVSSLSNVGPGVAGSWWLDNMFESDSRGFIRATGQLAGGHAYCVGGVIMELNAAVIYQSWGPVSTISDEMVHSLLVKHGLSPDLHSHVQLMDLGELWDLLQQDGEFCISLDYVPTEPLPDPEEKKGCVRGFLKQMWRPYRG